MGRGYSSLKWTSDSDWCNFLVPLSVLMKFSRTFPIKKKKKKKKRPGVQIPLKSQTSYLSFFLSERGQRLCVSVSVCFILFFYLRKRFLSIQYYSWAQVARIWFPFFCLVDLPRSVQILYLNFCQNRVCCLCVHVSVLFFTIFLKERVRDLKSCTTELKLF